MLLIPISDVNKHLQNHVFLQIAFSFLYHHTMDNEKHKGLKLLSMQGFKTKNRLVLPSQFSIDSEIQLPNSTPILWAQLKSKKKTLYAFGGLTLEISPSSNIHRLVKTLNSEKPCKLSDYLKGIKKTEELKTIQTLFQA